MLVLILVTAAGLSVVSIRVEITGAVELAFVEIGVHRWHVTLATIASQANQGSIWNSPQVILLPRHCGGVVLVAYRLAYCCVVSIVDEV